MENINKILVREYLYKSDYESSLKLFSELLSYESKLDPLRNGNVATAKKYFRDTLTGDKNEKRKIFVAMVENMVVGLVSTAVETSSSGIFKFKEYGYIRDLIVSEKFRRKNIGKLLMKKAYEYFSKFGLKYIRVEAINSNNTATNFYKNQGFETETISFIKNLKS